MIFKCEIRILIIFIGVNKNNQHGLEGMVLEIKLSHHTKSLSNCHCCQWNTKYDEIKGRKVEEVSLQSMDEEEGNEFRVDFKEMKKEARVQHAWARTINTFQVRLQKDRARCTFSTPLCLFVCLYSNSALLVLNGTSLNCNNALLALN